MNRKFKYHFTKLIFPFFSIGLLIYFIYHILNGSYGWFSWCDLNKKIVQDTEILTELEKDHKKLQNKVVLLRSDSLDPDLLDERVRAMLNNANEDDLIIIDENL